MFMMNKTQFLKQFLSESGIFTEEDVISLSEETKDASISEIATEVIRELLNKLQAIDDQIVIDKSKGDIRHFGDIQYLQNAITKLETIIEVSPMTSEAAKAKEYVQDIIKTLMYLNQYKDVFKAAYASKKTVIIMKYKELMMAIYSSVAYLMSTIVDFTSEVPGLKSSFDLKEIAPIQALKNFNTMANNGQFKKAITDVVFVRESFTEIPVEDLYSLTEAEGILDTITTGLNNFINGIQNNPTLTNILYKAMGILVLLISMREVIYTIYRSRHKFSDVIDSVKQFSLFDTHKISDKFKSFVNRYAVDVETASDVASRETVDQNKSLAKDIKALPPVSGLSSTTLPNETPAFNNDEFSFGF